jgi:hypothetical protein
MDVQNSTYKIRHGHDSQVGFQRAAANELHPRCQSPGELLTTGGKSFGVAKDNYKAWGGRDNCGIYLRRVVIGAVEMSKTERHPHKVGNSARLHLLHDRGPVMLGRPRADP